MGPRARAIVPKEKVVHVVWREPCNFHGVTYIPVPKEQNKPPEGTNASSPSKSPSKNGQNVDEDAGAEIDLLPVFENVRKRYKVRQPLS